MSAEIKMKLGDSEVLYDARHQTWTLDGVPEATLLKIAPERVAAISNALKHEVAIYQERIAREEAEKETARIATKQAEIDRFKALVEPLLPPGFTADFASAKSYSDVEVVCIRKDEVYADVKFSDKVFSGSYHHTTDRPWQISFNYKNSRQATLDKAIIAACRKIDEEIATQARLKAADEAAQKAKQNTAAYLAEQGIQLATKTVYMEGARGRRNGSSYKIQKAKIAVVDFDPKDNYSKKVVVSGNLVRGTDSYEVSHLTISGKFTLEQFKKLASAVKEIAPEPSSYYSD